MPLRVVIDTNILISLFMSRQHEDLIDSILDESLELISSQEQINEIERVLAYPKIAKFFDQKDMKKIMFLAENMATLVPLKNTILDCRDKKDNFILETAATGNAKYIVSGDKDIQALSPFRGITILDLNHFKKMANIGCQDNPSVFPKAPGD